MPATVHDQLRRRLLERAGVVSDPHNSRMSLEWIYETQWSVEFEDYMRNRLAMGFYRYGSLRSASRRRKPYDNVGSAFRHLREYLRGGNQEHLVDAANLCMVEFMVPSCHERPRFNAVDDGRHTPLRRSAIGGAP